MDEIDLSRSSFHGISRLCIHSKGFVKKFIWITACLSCAIAMLTNLVLVSQNYYKRQVTVKINYVEKRNLEFPACAAPWIEKDGKCFLLVKDKFKDIQEAREACWELGADFAVPSSHSVFVAASNMGSFPMFPKAVIIGVSDAHREGELISVQSTQLPSFLSKKTSGMSMGFSSNKAIQDCVTLTNNGFSSDMSYIKCCDDLPERVLCEKTDSATSYLNPNYFDDICKDDGEDSCKKYPSCTTAKDNSNKKCLDSINGYTCQDLPTSYPITYSSAVHSIPKPPTTISTPTTLAATTTTQSTTKSPTTTTTKLPTTITTTTKKPTTTKTPSTTMTTTAALTTATTSQATTHIVSTTEEPVETTAEAGETTVLPKETTSNEATENHVTSDATSTITPTTAEPSRKKLSLNDFLKSNMRESFELEEAVYSKVSDFSVEDRIHMGFQKSEFLLDCEFNGEKCSFSEFAFTHNPVHGNCYTFNSGFIGFPNSAKFAGLGPRRGLKLITNIQQDEYAAELGEAAGARVTVHPKNTIPFPEDDGILLEPGTLSSVAIKAFTHSRTPFPYSNCTFNNADGKLRNAFQELYKVNYTQATCLRTCYQYWVVKKCHCADPFYPRYAKALGSTRKVLYSCREAQETENCRIKVTQKFNKNRLKCKCPSLCREPYYRMQASKGYWPNDHQRDNVLRQLNMSSNNESALQNLLKVELFYESFLLKSTQEVPKYPQEEFTSDLGGTAGLFLGVSIITVAEGLEVILDLIYKHLLKRMASKLRAKLRTAEDKLGATRKDK